MKTILTILALSLPAMGGSVVLGWQPQEGATFKVWRGTELVKTVRGNQATVRLPDSGVSTVRVTASTPYGESMPAEIHLLPVVVLTSLDNQTWDNWRVLYVETTGHMFFKLTPPEVLPLPQN